MFSGETKTSKLRKCTATVSPSGNGNAWEVSLFLVLKQMIYQGGGRYRVCVVCSWEWRYLLRFSPVRL